MNRRIAQIFSIALFLNGGLAQAQDNWPQWRGPEMNGISNAKNLPTTWSETENIVWKAALPSWSGATPIVWGDYVFVTSPTEADTTKKIAEQPRPSRPSRAQRPEGQRQGGQNARGGRGRGRGGRMRGPARNPGGDELMLIALSAKDGKELWRQTLDAGNALHRKHNNASPSPVTDGKHVWVVTGTGAVAAFDMKGGQKWQKNLQKEYGEFGLGWGYASSPLLYDGKLIVQVLHGRRTDDPSYVLAFNAANGEVLWRVERPTDALMESPDAYTTPVISKHDGKTHIVISGGDYVTGHDPKTGEEIWRAAGLNPEKRRNYRVVASPVSVGDMIYTPSRRKPLLALRAGGNGDVTESHLVWKWEGGSAPDVPTPVSDGVYFYMVDDRGLASCLNAKTGELVWGPVRTAQGIVSASPVLADGKIYITNENAITTVLSSGGEEPEILATNELDGNYALSSLAVAGSRLFLRTSTHLYCIGK